MQMQQVINSGKPPRKALNKAFLKLKSNQSQIGQFQENLIQLRDRNNETESEEFKKTLLTNFLNRTYYEPHHFNQIGRLFYELYGLTEE